MIFTRSYEDAKSFVFSAYYIKKFRSFASSRLNFNACGA